MIDVSIHNFRGLSRARLVDDSPLSVIVGLNQSGKTSLAQAIGFAFSGTVLEISDPRQLVRHGHADLRIRLNLPGWTIERTLTRGPNVSEIAARLGNIPVKLLPLLFESSATLNYSAHLSAFLNSLENGVDDCSDILRSDPDARALFLQALRMRQGKLRSCLYHAKEQGERLYPRICPAEPREPKPDAGQLETARAALQAATNAHNAAIEASEVCSERRTQLAAAREWYSAQERFETASSRAGPDCLGENRVALERLAEVGTDWLERTGLMLLAAGREDISTQLVRVQSEIEAARGQAAQALSLHAHEAIPTAPEPLPEETQAALQRVGVDCSESLEGVAKRLAEAWRRADQAVAETRIALSEAQSRMIKRVFFCDFTREPPQYLIRSHF